MPTPTPNPTIISGGDGCDLFGVCPTPTSPTPTPVEDGTPTPTPMPTPTSGQDGFTFDPDIVTPIDGYGYGVAQWTYGQWQGAGQCGQRSHLTREVGCQVAGFPVEVIGRNDGVPSFGRSGTQLASYAPGKAPVAAPAIFDPSSSDVKVRLAQFGPGGGGDMQITTVPIEICMEQLGAPPPNTYDGDQAGCEYEPVDEGYSEWMLGDFGQGTATCSAQAYRTPHFSCRAPDGSPADMQYCLENVREGGTRNGYMVDAQYGNYSGCKTGWVGEADDNYCYDPNTGDEGANHYAYYTYHCARSNGDILTGPDEAGCTGPKPSDGYKVVGSCSKVFYFGYTGQACEAGYSGENVLGILNIEGNDIYNSTKGSDFCTSLGATCCSQRMVSNSNYSKAPYGTTQIVATRTDYVRSSGWRFDEGAFRISRDGEGPYFYDYGGYEDHVTDATDDFHIDDPDNVLDGGYLNHPYYGGGEN